MVGATDLLRERDTRLPSRNARLRLTPTEHERRASTKAKLLICSQVSHQAPLSIEMAVPISDSLRWKGGLHRRRRK